MYELFDECESRIAECKQKAKSARNKDDRHSWLAMEDSWRQTAELRQLLERQEWAVLAENAVDMLGIAAA